VLWYDQAMRNAIGEAFNGSSKRVDTPAGHVRSFAIHAHLLIRNHKDRSD